MVISEMAYDEIIDRKVKEGLRVGKVPWSCSSYVQERAYDILNSKVNHYPQEAYLESQKRWAMEGVITWDEYYKRVKEDKEWENKCLFRKVEDGLKKLEKNNLLSEFIGQNDILKNFYNKNAG